MESSLHRQLKKVYATEGAALEVPLKKYRIDVVRGEELIEIQHGNLASIRSKIAALVKTHELLVVKPIIARKRIIKLGRRGNQPKSTRWSPKRGTILDVFTELIYLTRVFPHPRLTIEVPLIEMEERRRPGHGKRRYRRENDFVIEDQTLLEIQSTFRFSTNEDLLDLFPEKLPRPFHTGHLADQLGQPRWLAQRMTYCLRHTGGLAIAGKQGNALLYEVCRGGS